MTSRIPPSMFDAARTAHEARGFDRDVEPPIIPRHFDVVDLDLSKDSWNDPQLSGRGFGVFFLVEGSQPGARLDVESNGSWRGMRPGDEYTGSFDGLIVRRGADSVTSGYARLLVLRHPAVEVRSMPRAGEAFVIASGSGDTDQASFQLIDNSADRQYADAERTVRWLDLVEFFLYFEIVSQSDPTARYSVSVPLIDASNTYLGADAAAITNLEAAAAASSLLHGIRNASPNVNTAGRYYATSRWSKYLRTQVSRTAGTGTLSYTFELVGVWGRR